jgi:hypothetical protein
MTRSPDNPTLIRPRPWLVLLSFLLALVALNYLVWSQRALWHAYDPHPYRERLDICRSQSWNLVVVGGSPAAYAIDPRVLAGLRFKGRPLTHACNVALPLATSAEVFHMTEHGIRRRPRLLVYGICATEFKEDRVEPLGPMLLMDARDVAAWSRHRPDAASWCVGKFLQQRWDNLCPMTYYRPAVKRWAADKLEECCPGLCTPTADEAQWKLNYSVSMYMNHGFMPQKTTPDTRLDLLKAGGKRLKGYEFLDNYEATGYLTYLHRLIDWAERRDVPLVLVEIPTSADLEAKFPAAFASFRARLCEVERERGVRVLRPTRPALGLEERHYADVIHLNADGAAILSAWLRHELTERSAAP